MDVRQNPIWERGYDVCQKTRFWKDKKIVNMQAMSDAKRDRKGRIDELLPSELEPPEPSSLDEMNEPEQLTTPEESNVFPALTK